MDTWSQGRVGLIGDAAFCPSLLAGQGAALAMTAAYVLAGELAQTGGAPQQAFKRYENRLHPFIAGKQKSAADFAGSFTPKTRLGLFFRNQVSKMFRFPFIAEFAGLRGKAQPAKRRLLRADSGEAGRIGIAVHSAPG